MRPKVIDVATFAIAPPARAAELLSGAGDWCVENYGRSPTGDEWARWSETYKLAGKLFAKQARETRRQERMRGAA